MRLYFVRHGESKYNRLHLHQHGQVELSPEGLKQAKRVAKRFTKINFDTILSSDYTRAHQTAEAIAQATGQKLVVNKLLRETKKPSEIAHLHFDHKEAVRIKKLIADHLGDENWHYSDEENWFDRKERALKFWKFIPSVKHENIVVVTHEEFLQMLLAVMLFGEDLTVREHAILVSGFRHKNTGITVFEGDKGHWHLVTWNDHAHLG